MNHWTGFTRLFMNLSYINHSCVAACVHDRTSWKLLLSKKFSLCTSSLPKSTIALHNAAERMFWFLMKLSSSCLGSTCSTTSDVERSLHTNMKPHSNSETWWREHLDFALTLICFLWAWTAHHPSGEKEFPGLSRYLTGYCQVGCCQLKLSSGWVMQQNHGPSH